MQPARIEPRKSDYKWPIDGTQPSAFAMMDAYGPHVVADYALDLITRHADDDEPFFLYYPLKLPDLPVVPSPETAFDPASEEDQHGKQLVEEMKAAGKGPKEAHFYGPHWIKTKYHFKAGEDARSRWFRFRGAGQSR